MTIQRLIGILALGTLTVGAPAQAALVVSDASEVIQEDFSFLADSGSFNVWTDDAPTASAQGSPGWVLQTNVASPNYSAGFAISPGPHSLRAEVNPDDALGYFGGAGHEYAAWGLVLQNNSGQEITGVTVSYRGEQHRRTLESGLVDSLNFSFQVSATDISDYQAAGGAAPAGWTAATALDFTPPANEDGDGVIGYKEGPTLITDTLAVSLPSGSYIALRWHDAFDAMISGQDAALGIDDVQVSFQVAAVPEASQLAMGGLASLAGAWAWRRRRGKTTAPLSRDDG